FLSASLSSDSNQPGNLVQTGVERQLGGRGRLSLFVSSPALARTAPSPRTRAASSPQTPRLRMAPSRTVAVRVRPTTPPRRPTVYACSYECEKEGPMPKARPHVQRTFARVQSRRKEPNLL